MAYGTIAPTDEYTGCYIEGKSIHVLFSLWIPVNSLVKLVRLEPDQSLKWLIKPAKSLEELIFGKLPLQHVGLFSGLVGRNH